MPQYAYLTVMRNETKTLIAIHWFDWDGSEAVTRHRSEFDAVLFEESLDAEGLSHWRTKDIR